MSAELSKYAERWVLVAAILGSSMVFIDATAVNVALPAIQHDLLSSNEDLQWAVEGYALLLSAFLLVGGALGDVYGRRRVFCIGIAGFALASAACTLAPNMMVLNIARAVQGIAAALATPGSLALISVAFAPERRGKAIGTWSGFGAMTGAIGPLLGGWLVQHVSWRAVFVINLPLALGILAIAARFVPESRDESAPRRIDIPGALLACLGLGGMTYALIGFQSPAHLRLDAICLVLSTMTFAAFVVWEAYSNHPMMPLAHFRNRLFSTLNIYTFFLYAALGGSLFFVPFNLQNIQGYSPTEAGAAFLPFILILFVSSRWSGGLAERVGLRLPLTAGAVLAAGGFLLYRGISIGGSYWTTFFPAACVLGCGGALFVAPLTTAIMSSLDASFASTASGVNNAVARIAGLLAIAVLGLLLSINFYHTFDRQIAATTLSEQSRTVLARERATLASGHVPQAIPVSDRPAVTVAVKQSYIKGFRFIMVVSAGLCLAAAILAYLRIAS